MLFWEFIKNSTKIVFVCMLHTLFGLVHIVMGIYYWILNSLYLCKGSFLIRILHKAHSSSFQFTYVGFLFKKPEKYIPQKSFQVWTWHLWVWRLESNIAPQYQYCKVVRWPWSDQSEQRMSSRHIIIYKYGTWVSAISIFIALRKMILHEALAPSAISFFRVQ